MRVHPFFKVLLVGFVVGVLAVSQARADELYGRIRGTITDPSGAVIAGAQVTATNVETGISKQVTSGADGSYEFLQLLAPATYSISVRQSGFKQFEAQDIHLQLNQVFALPVKLELGAISQLVSVEAVASQINTTSMELGNTVTSTTIQDMPLVGRNWLQLQQLQPGVMGASDRFGAGTLGTNYATNGAETQQNSFYINGVDTADIALNAAGIIPSPDAIAEFHLVTSTINPEYGRNSGAVMNAVIKSGSNSLHGDGFEFYRDTFLNARNFFQESVSPYHQNQFGGTIGGPILIPHVYNGRDKTFFFFSYQGIRNVVPQAYSVPHVYTQAQRNGAFADLATSTGISAKPLVGDDGSTYPAGTPYSTIFSAGTIPTVDMDPLAVKLMNQYVPLANAPNNGYQFNPSITHLNDQYISRIDQNFGSNDSIWGYMYWEREPTTATLPFAGAHLPGFGEINRLHNQQYSLSWTHTFSPTTVNEARFGYFRINYDAVEPQNPVNPTSYGFSGIIAQNPTSASIPVMSVSGLFTLGFSEYGPQPRLENTYQVIDNFSKVVGKHTLKAGFTTDRFQVYNPFYSFLSGYFSFSKSGGTYTTGDAGANFLLGLPGLYLQSNGAIIDTRAREYYMYAQDEWKVRPNLTITYGTGWDIETPYTNRYYGGEDVNAFRPGVQSKVFPGAPTGILWPGDAGITDTGGVNTPYHNLAPRLGFAWSPGGSKNWSIHAGYGFYYNRTEEELALQNLVAPPFSLTSEGVIQAGGSPSLAAPFTGWCGKAAPTPCSTPQQFPFTPKFGAGVDFSPFEPMVVNVVSPHFGVPYSENFNLTLEHQLSSSMTLSVAYVGNVGRHLEGTYELNPAGSMNGNPVAAAAGCGPSGLWNCAPQTFRYNPLTTNLGSIEQQSTEFNSRYNSLQISVNKRLSGGLSFLAAYTLGSFWDQNSTADNQDGFIPPGINAFSPGAAMYGPSDNDARQRFVFSYDYTLPIYHYAKRFRPLTDGWKLVGIATFQTGFPVRITNTDNPSLTCSVDLEQIDAMCWDRPNPTGKPIAIGNPRTYNVNEGGSVGSNYYFNPYAFTEGPLGGALTANAQRNLFHGPGINNFDLSLMKDIHITEAKYIELRFETYNTFNHTQFTPYSYQPNNDIGGVDADTADGPAFGQVVAAQGARAIQLAAKIYF